MNDPIIEEIHRYREELAKRFHYDIRAMTEYVCQKYADYPNHVDLSEQARRKHAARVAEQQVSYGKKGE